ncbi:MAG: hypothetical protein ACPGAE_00175 [Neptuniibacter sp.]
MSKHLTEKFANKLEKEGIQVKDNGIRFTVTHLNGKGKVLGRDWYKGYIGITDKRLPWFPKVQSSSTSNEVMNVLLQLSS